MTTNPATFLTVGCKKTTQVSFKEAILSYVNSVYGQQHVEDVSSDLDEVCQLRTTVQTSSTGGGSENAVSELARYYKALSLMETRFPISPESGHVQIYFPWTDAVQTKKMTRQMNIHLEKSSVAFNIAAMLSQQAASKNKNTSDGCKDSAQAFQEASGAFQKVEEAATKVESPCPKDLSSDTLAVLRNLMLAQAQECAYLKAEKDRKTSGVLARLCKQASFLYSDVLGYLSKPSMKDYFDKTWQTTVQIKSWFLDALCQQYAAEGVTDGKDIGAEVSRLRQASHLLEKIRKTAKGSSFPLNEIKSMGEVVNARLTAAEKDNFSVYLVRVQPFGELPPIQGYQLVKSISPSVFDASQDHLFSTLVPESITKAMSRYSELLDDLVRGQTSLLDGATDDARIKLKLWELPEMLDGVSSAPVAMLPESLAKDLDEVEQCGGAPYLSEVKEQVKSVRESIEQTLVQVESFLDSEALADAEQRTAHGSSWVPPPSSSLNGQFRQLISSYRNNLQSAVQSDALVVQKMRDNIGMLSRLTRATVTQNLPPLNPPIMNIGSTEPAAVVDNIKKALDQMNAVSRDRAGIEDSFKDQKQKDNILPKLMADGGANHEELFKKALGAYDGLKEDVKENLERQQKLLQYLEQAVQVFRETYSVEEWQSRIDGYAGEVKQQVKVFLEIRDNLGEGMRFYTSLQEAVDILKQQVSDFLMTREVQRKDHIERLKSSLGNIAKGAIQGLSRMFTQSYEDSSAPEGQPPGNQPPHDPHPGYNPSSIASPSPYAQPSQELPTDMHSTSLDGSGEMGSGTPPPAQQPPHYPPQHIPPPQQYGQPPQMYNGQYQPQQGYMPQQHPQQMQPPPGQYAHGYFGYHQQPPMQPPPNWGPQVPPQPGQYPYYGNQAPGQAPHGAYPEEPPSYHPPA